MPGAAQEWDDGHYHPERGGTFSGGLRLNLVARPVAITRVRRRRVIPSSPLPRSTAHAAVGKGSARALAVGGAVGGFLGRLCCPAFSFRASARSRTADIVGIPPESQPRRCGGGLLHHPAAGREFLEFWVTHDGFDLVGFLPMTDARFHSTGEDIPPISGIITISFSGATS